MDANKVSQGIVQKIKCDIPSNSLNVKHALSYLTTIREHKVFYFKNSKFLYRLKDSIMEFFGFNTKRKIALAQFKRQCDIIVERNNQKASLKDTSFILEVNNVESSNEEDLNNLSPLFDFIQKNPDQNNNSNNQANADVTSQNMKLKGQHEAQSAPNNTFNVANGNKDDSASKSAVNAVELNENQADQDYTVVSAVNFSGNKPAADQDNKGLSAEPIVVPKASANNTIPQGAISSGAPSSGAPSLGAISSVVSPSDAPSSDVSTGSTSNKFTTSTIQYDELTIQQMKRVFKMNTDKQRKFCDRYDPTMEPTRSMQTKQKLWDESIATYIKDHDFSNDLKVTISSLDMTDADYRAYIRTPFVPDWSLIQSDPGYIPINPGEKAVSVVFGNVCLGGGVCGNGWVQEEQRVFLSPQIMSCIDDLQKEKYQMNMKQSMLLEGAHSFEADTLLFKNYYAGGGIARLRQDLNSGAIKSTDLIPNKLLHETAILSLHAENHAGEAKHPSTREELTKATEQYSGANKMLKEAGYTRIFSGAVGAGAYKGSEKASMLLQATVALMFDLEITFCLCSKANVEYVINNLKMLANTEQDKKLTTDIAIDFLMHEAEKDISLQVGQ